MINKNKLKELPRRDWDERKPYDSICVIPSGKKHDSGYSLMYIIGMIDSEPVEIAASCDDICWKIPEQMQHEFRTDMFYKPHVIHFWSRKFKFEVGASLSSTNVRLIKKEG